MADQQSHDLEGAKVQVNGVFVDWDLMLRPLQEVRCSNARDRVSKSHPGPTPAPPGFVQTDDGGVAVLRLLHRLDDHVGLVDGDRRPPARAGYLYPISAHDPEG